MTAYFSGTDWENLHDRADVSNYFMMLIVNFTGKWCAKIGFKAKKSGTSGVKLDLVNNVDGFDAISLVDSPEKDVLVVVDCNIEIENGDVDDVFKERWAKVVAVQKEEEKKKRKWQPPGPSTWVQGKLIKNEDLPATRWNGYTEGEKEYEYPEGVWRKKKDKKIGDMTDKEWEQWEMEQQARDIFIEDQSEHISKFDIRHAKAFLNSILHGTYMPDNFIDCMREINAQEYKLNKMGEYEEYIEEFEEMLQEHFDVIFPHKNEDDYRELLIMVQEYLTPYLFRSKLVKMMLDAVKDEIELLDQPVKA